MHKKRKKGEKLPGGRVMKNTERERPNLHTLPVAPGPL